MEDITGNLELRLAQVQNPRDEIDTLNELAWDLRHTQPEKASELARKTEALSASGEFSAAPYQQGQAASLTTQGFLNHQAGRLDVALSQCLEAAVLLDKLPPSGVAVNCRRTISWIFYFLGDQSSALSYALQALRLAQQLNLPVQEATVLDGLAMIYSASGDSAQALQSNEAALRNAQAAGDQLLETTVLNNRALMLKVAGNYCAALESAQQSLQLACRLSLNVQRVSILDTLGGILIEQGDYAQAKQILWDGLALAEETGSGLAQIYYHINLGDLHLKQSDMSPAFNHFQMALARAASDGMRGLQSECHLRLSVVCECQGDQEQALAHYKLFYALHEKAAGETSQRQLAILKVVHQVETAQRDAEIYRLRNVEMQSEIDERKRMEIELQRLATVDMLTGVFNRRHFFVLAQREFARAVRNHRPLTALAMDLDHFKSINDTYGHGTGDQVLAQVGAIILQNFRGEDVIGRYGGDEFCIVLPETCTGHGRQAAERLQEFVAQQRLATPAGSLSLTVSIGFSSLAEDMAAKDSLENLLDRADQALYRAKRAGRNRVCGEERVEIGD